jgi:hypothetical protein
VGVPQPGRPHIRARDGDQHRRRRDGGGMTCLERSLTAAVQRSKRQYMQICPSPHLRMNGTSNVEFLPFLLDYDFDYDTAVRIPK